MEHGVQDFLDGVVQDLGGNVQLIRSAVRTLPYLGGGAVAVAPRLALNCDDGDRQRLSGEEIRIECIIDVFQLADGPAHFGGLFHDTFLPESK